MIVSNLEEVPCQDDQKGRYDFKCINQLCPYNEDVFYCFHSFSDEVKELFQDLFDLRASLTSPSEVEVEPECIQQT
ncbi:MAG: hypothetical protein R6U44_07815 [Archaeoglobaceae archaeon]